MAIQRPYSRMAPIHCKCVANRTNRKTVTYNTTTADIRVQIKSVSAISGGTNVYIVTKNGEETEFKEEVTYSLKNITLGTTLLPPEFFSTSTKFRAAPLTPNETGKSRKRGHLSTITEGKRTTYSPEII